jgi:hypothetical protein
MLTAAAVVVCALDLLGRSLDTTVPIRFLEHAPRGASKNVEAFVMRDPDRIYLITSTEAFRDAVQGPRPGGGIDGCRKVASIIVHEEWHLRHGEDEEGAYLAQLMTLTQLGAPGAMITSVRRSMRSVIAAQKSRPKPELIAVRR